MRSARRGTPTPMFVRPRRRRGTAHGHARGVARRPGHAPVSPVGSLAELERDGAVARPSLAVPAFEAARLLATAAPTSAAALTAIPYASTGVVFLVYRRRDPGGAAGRDRVRRPARQGAHDGVHVDQQQVARPGVRLPRGASAATSAASATRTCWRRPTTTSSTRAPGTWPRCSTCRRRARSRPSVVRWMRAMPQYEVGHAGPCARRSGEHLPAGYLRGGLRLRRRGHPRLRPRGGRDGRAGPGAPRPRDDRKGDRSMSDTDQTDVPGSTFALYPAFRARDGFRDLSADGLADVVQEVENLYKSFDGRVEVRGHVLDGGVPSRRGPAALARGDRPPRTSRRSWRSSAGRRREGSPTSRGRSWAWSSRRSSRPTTSRRSSRVCRRRRSCACTRSCARRSGTCCRARSAARCSPSTAESGREFPDVLANTTSAFGLGDWEWILAFEADRVDVDRRLHPPAPRREGTPLHEGRDPVHHGDPQERRGRVRRPRLTGVTSDPESEAD